MGYVMELRKLIGSRPIVLTGSCILLCDQNQLLLQKRADNGLWGLPGGALEPGESLDETAKRELYEETGLTAQSLTFFRVFSGKELYYQYPHGDEVYSVVSAYICREFQGELDSDNTETEELRFFPLDEIPENLHPVDRPIVKVFLEHSKM
ncbi:MAG: NUDIX hydrolase [Bacillaceae bacterium]|nr:NUDIX hydrolase [Bacillaceae bacterium]